MDKLLQKLKKVPPKPGIYFLKNKNNEIIYIGKAKNLKKRLKSHYEAKKSGNKELNSPFAKKLYEEFIDFKIEVLKSEIEALIEESKYIKNLKPRYNILLRDDKNYFYVGFVNDELPHLFLTHQPKIKPNTEYIGPFTNGSSLKYTLRLLRRLYPYKTCKNKFEKPCFYFHLGLCPAHSKTKKNLKQIKEITNYNLEKVKQVLKGKGKSIIIRLKKQLKIASEDLQYEKADEILKEIKAIKNIFAHKNIITDQEYSEKYEAALVNLRSILKLKKIPGRIEIYDISNLGQDYLVGAMTVFTNGKIAPNEFRLFKIKYDSSIGDPQRIYEVVLRRLAHNNDTSKNQWPKPDVILIDGGKNQLSYAAKALNDSKIKTKNKIKLISLAKQNNILYIYKSLKNFYRIDLQQRQLKNLENFLLFLINSAHKFAKKYLNKVLLQKIKIKD